MKCLFVSYCVVLDLYVSPLFCKYTIRYVVNDFSSFYMCVVCPMLNYYYEMSVYCLVWIVEASGSTGL